VAPLYFYVASTNSFKAVNEPSPSESYHYWSESAQSYLPYEPSPVEWTDYYEPSAVELFIYDTTSGSY